MQPRSTGKKEWGGPISRFLRVPRSPLYDLTNHKWSGVSQGVTGEINPLVTAKPLSILDRGRVSQVVRVKSNISHMRAHARASIHSLCNILKFTLTTCDNNSKRCNGAAFNVTGDAILPVTPCDTPDHYLI